MQIKVKSAYDGLRQTIELMRRSGHSRSSRNGPVIVLPEPVMITVEEPVNCIIDCEYRDANPFLHLAEVLYFFKGENSIKPLAHIVPRMKEYSDDGETFNAPYGHRLKHQLEVIIAHLEGNNTSRRAVISTWSRNENLSSNDVPCNTQFMFEIDQYSGKLNMTSINRSNDAVWGLWGVNCVVFSYMMQYVAAKLDTRVGKWTHFSNNLHVYTDGPGGAVWKRIRQDYHPIEYKESDYGRLRYLDVEDFDWNVETQIIMKDFKRTTDWFKPSSSWGDIMADLFIPAFRVYDIYRQNGTLFALEEVEGIRHFAWRLAITNWLKNSRRNK